MTTTLAALIVFLEQSKYVLLAIGSFIEGSAVMMTGGLLWRVGVVAFLPTLVALFIGDVLSDIMWYAVGRFGARSFLTRWGHLINLTPPIVDKIEERFHRYHAKILAASKLTMGLGLAVPVLTVAGMLRVPFGRYVLINVVCGIIWILMLMGIGYYFGNVLSYIPKDLEIALIIIVPVLFFIGIKILSKRLETIEW